MNLTHVQLMCIPVSDQERAKAFYVDTLGFELLYDDQSSPEMRWVEVRPVAGQTSLVLVTWFPTMPPGSLEGLVIATDDMDAAYKELAARGVTFDGPIQDAPWGRYATFDDPDGNGLILQGEPEGGM